MSLDKTIDTIRKCFSHIDVVDIVVEYDPIIEADVAKVMVREEDLSVALKQDGIYARKAAIQSGFSVEVVLAAEQTDDE